MSSKEEVIEVWNSIFEKLMNGKKAGEALAPSMVKEAGGKGCVGRQKLREQR